MNETKCAIFNGYSSSGRTNWIQLDDLVKEPNGFQICIYKDPSDSIKGLSNQRIPIVVTAVPLFEILGHVERLSAILDGAEKEKA